MIDWNLGKVWMESYMSGEAKTNLKLVLAETRMKKDEKVSASESKNWAWPKPSFRSFGEKFRLKLVLPKLLKLGFGQWFHVTETKWFLVMAETKSF